MTEDHVVVLLHILGIDRSRKCPLGHTRRIRRMGHVKHILNEVRDFDAEAVDPAVAEMLQDLVLSTK